MIELAIADDLIDLRDQELLTLLFAKLRDLVLEGYNIHLSLQFIANTIFGDQAQSFHYVLQRLLFFRPARYQRTQGVLIERAATFWVHISDHLCYLGLAGIHIKTANDCAEVARLNKSIRVLVEE